MLNHKKFWCALWLIGVAMAFIGLVGNWDRYCEEWHYKKLYKDAANWAYFAEGGDNKPVDVFLIAPSVDTKDEFIMRLDDEETKQKFLGALNMERGIYEDNARLYAPYYSQGSLKVYDFNLTSDAEREKYLKIAYKDVKAAFIYYLKHENKGRPFILAGFSQGADMCLRLARDFLGCEKLNNKLIAIYAIGWPLDYEFVNKYNYIKPAVSSNDIGVAVTLECEAPDVKETDIYKADVKSYAINPLSWRVDEVKADKDFNLGACFTDYSGKINKEINNFCGAYLDLTRGVVKIPAEDVNKDEYKAYLSFLPEGCYHIYDYLFFYRNLQENVKVRINAYLNRERLKIN